ncbi:hypothetical protein G4G28_07595 [Massilia sp. Dwa41.01b]|uniref:hypothetical protein n=1 Tax=unclassified Massilia TaxID=2609279 RepID=UPI001601E5AD|nr:MULTISPECIES: hypothetical protein [unclassified Massilia]QNA88394.1 hypothetical protein G4G28_07595 [Massilia sp. Dwa41.01b]QNA99292.1 hypothetical protein G4G31_11295 [Massilia sp. Se16.2.3]
MGIARNVEVWIFGAFGALCLAACLSGPSQRAAPSAGAGMAPGMAEDVALAQPDIEQMQPMYVVYVVGKRPGGAAKRAPRQIEG